jgi:hypothetical protein
VFVRSLVPLILSENAAGHFGLALWRPATLGATDVVEEEFLRLARDSGLYADLGSHADADLRHIIRWAMLDQNPFQ